MPPAKLARSLLTAVGVTAGAGAAQLGLGYGLGIFAWVPTVHDVDKAAWLASLAWTVFVCATSVGFGAIVADRTVEGATSTTSGRVLVRLIVSVAAALGGVLVVGLMAIPARTAPGADTSAPMFVVGGYAIAGLLLGLLVSLAAVPLRAFAANLVASTIWFWLLTGVAVVDNLWAGGKLRVTQLDMWLFTSDGPWAEDIYLPAAALAGVAALLIGAFAAWPSAQRGQNRLGVALSGVTGPAIVAVAYLLAAPRLEEVAPRDLSAHLFAPYAVIVGLIGSVLVAVVAGGPRRTAPAAPAPRQPAPAIEAAPEKKDDEPTTAAEVKKEEAPTDSAASPS